MNAKTIAKELKKADKIVFFHHIRPDGDAISSSYALMKAMQSKYPNKIIKWVPDEEYLNERFPYLNLDFKSKIDKIDQSWLAVIGDNAILDRIYNYELFQNAGRFICFDHHPNQVDFKVDVYWQQSDFGASAMQSYQIAKKLNIKFNSEIALLFVFGILTDTGNFQYTLADHRPLELAAELFHYIDNDDIAYVYKEMRTKNPKDINIQSWALNNFKHEKGVVYCNLTKDVQKKLKLAPHECARVNLIANIANSEAWLFFIEDVENNCIRVEFRSHKIPINQVAFKFGGGGHQWAAGAKIPIDWKLTKKIVKEVQDLVKSEK